jgi:hypothetical protein
MSKDKVEISKDLILQIISESNLVGSDFTKEDHDELVDCVKHYNIKRARDLFKDVVNEKKFKFSKQVKAELQSLNDLIYKKQVADVITTKIDCPGDSQKCLKSLDCTVRMYKRDWQADHLVSKLQISLVLIRDRYEDLDVNLLAHYLFSLNTNVTYGPPNIIILCPHCEEYYRGVTYRDVLLNKVKAPEIPKSFKK